MLKLLIVWIITNYGILLKRQECQTTLPASWETYMQVKKQQLEPDMEKWTGSKLAKEYIKAVYIEQVILTNQPFWHVSSVFNTSYQFLNRNIN